MWKLIQITNNVFDWEAKLEIIKPIIQFDSVDLAVVKYYLQIVEQYLRDYAGIAIVQNTFKIIKDCNYTCYTGVRNPLIPIVDCFPNACIPFDTNFEAGADPSPTLLYDISMCVKNMYNGCECLSKQAMQPLNKYINPIMITKESALCYCNQM